MLSGNQCTAVGAHHTGNIRSDHCSSGQQLERAKHGFIIEGSPLYNDIVPQILGVADFDDLLERILNDRIRKPRRQIGQRGSFLLHLLHFGIHKDRAARAQINRLGGFQCSCSKLPDAKLQCGRKALQEGAAARRAGFVQHQAVDGTAADLDALHILPADVQDEIDLRHEFGGCLVMSNGLHFAAICTKRSLDQAFTISGCIRTGNMAALRENPVNFLQGIADRLQGVAFVASIKGIENFICRSGNHQLGSGRPGINAEIAGSLICIQLRTRSCRLAVAEPELLQILRRGEQRLQLGILGAVSREIHGVQPGQPAGQRQNQRIGLRQRGTDGDKILRMLRKQHLAFFQPKRFGKTLPQRGQKGQWPA
ncbi:hypothetical protein D3C76_209160 [compost metagenome]